MHPFQLMSEPIRRRIVEVLASGSHASGQIAQVVEVEFGVSRRAVSWHLAILLENGWVGMRVEGATHHYVLASEALDSLHAEIDWLDALWSRRIGWYSDNDTDPSTAGPIERRGRRGRNSEDPWRQALR